MRKPSQVFFRGYTKKEGDHWVAVCVDLNIVAQGSTKKEAEDECREAIVGYLEYVESEYPDRINEFIPRPAPKEFEQEFFDILKQMMFSRSKRAPQKTLANYDFNASDLAFCEA